MWVTSGAGIIDTDKKQYDVSAGDMLLFTGYEYHDLLVTSETLDFEVISFAPKFVWSVGSDRFDYLFLEPFFNRSKHFENKVLDAGTARKVTLLMKEIRSELEKKQPKFALAVKAKLLDILVYLVRSPQQQASIAGKNGYNAKYIEESMIYIGDNLDKPLPLEQLAKRCSMSVSYYSMLFKKMTGISPGLYITERRLDLAMELLENPDYNISEAAAKSGFHDITNFNKIFKKYVKLTPREYKKLSTDASKRPAPPLPR